MAGQNVFPRKALDGSYVRVSEYSQLKNFQVKASTECSGSGGRGQGARVVRREEGRKEKDKTRKNDVHVGITGEKRHYITGRGMQKVLFPQPL